MARTSASIDQKGQNHRSEVEHDARTALELSAGRTFGDREWEQMRRKLIEFYAILRDWEKQDLERQKKSNVT